MNSNNIEIKLGSLKLDLEANQIICGEECIQVEPKLVEVLDYLFKNRNSVVSREVLIAEVWQGQVISDNAISRSISQLRKLLALSSHPAPLIETIPKVGYRLVITHQKNTKPKQENNRNAKKLFTNRKRKDKRGHGFDFASLKVILFAVFTTSIFVNYLWQQMDSPAKPVDYVQSTLTHAAGIEKLAKFSPDGKFIAYAHSEKESGDEYLFLINPLTQKVKQITNSPAYILKSAWSPDSTKMVYSYWKNIHERQCAINIILFDSNQNVLSDKKLLDCTDRAFVNLAWNENGEKLYFNSRESFDRPYSVHSYSFVSNRITQLTLPHQQGNFRGDHFIAGNLTGSRIVVGRYLSATKIDLRVYDTRMDSIISRNILNENISDITWLGNTNDLLLKIDGKLYRYNHLKNRRQLYHTINKDASSLSTDIDAQRVVFTRSDIDVNLLEFELSSGRKTRQITAQTSDELMPAYANNSNAIAYISDRSGKLQIWLKDEKGQDSKISDSPVSIGITPIKWSPNDKHILFQHQDEIYLLNVIGRSIQRIIDYSHKAYVANWSLSGDSIFYSSEKSGEWQIWQYFLFNQQHMQITFEGAYSANQHENGDLYYSKIHQSGMWKLSHDNLSKPTFSNPIKVFEQFDGTNWISWQLSGSSLYFISVEEQGKGLFRYDIINKSHQLVYPFNETHLRYFSVKDDRVIFTVLENRESSIEILHRVD